MSEGAAQRWSAALAEWAVPDWILALAPEPPWVLPPEFFRVAEADLRDGRPSVRLARAALGSGGSVVDVGCGGGAASVPLVPQAVRITGVDERAAMLGNFVQACTSAGVAHSEVEGRWPDVAAEVEPADIAVCHHVVYNVAPIEPFLRALTGHARSLVVVELTETHPTSPFNSLWQRFWELPRPLEPTAQLFVEVVRELGYEPSAESFARPQEPPSMSRSDYVTFARRRLCLTPDRDPEIDEALGASWPLEDPRLVTVTWEPAVAQRRGRSAA